MSYKGSGKKFMDVVTYIGNGEVRSIDGLEFSPDLVWIKSTGVDVSHALYDTIRGPGNRLSSDSSEAEFYDVLSLTGFTPDGFTLDTDGTYGYTNFDSYGEYVAWCWNAGDETVTNNDGTITSNVRANQDSGFSVVTWNNASAAGTVGHGLDNTPSVIIVKSRSAAVDWNVYHKSLGNNKFLILNDAGAASTFSNYWNITESSIGVDANNSSNTGSMIAYCWSEVPGYSKFNSYTGNGSETFIYTGFKPSFVMVKRTDNSGSWQMYDYKRSPVNPRNAQIKAESTQREVISTTNWGIDFLSNGFRAVTGNSGENAAGGSYIFMAFAEQPFGKAQKKRLTMSSTQDFKEVLNRDVLTQYPNANASGVVDTKDTDNASIDVYVDGLSEDFAPNTNQTTTKPVTPPSSKRWTWAAWVKRGTTVASDPTYGGAGVLYQSGPDGPDYGSTGMGRFMFSSDDAFMIEYFGPGAGQVSRIKFNRSFTDVSSWFHITVTYDAISGEGFKVYFNGVRDTDTQQDSLNPIVNGDFSFPINRTGELMYIGNHGPEEYEFDGYLADLQFIDGQAITPDQLLTNNVSREDQLYPAKYGGWYGTRGYRLPMYGRSIDTSSITNVESTPGNWDVVSAHPSTWSCVGYGNGRYVALPVRLGGMISNKAMYSDDGVNWTLSSSLPQGGNSRNVDLTWSAVAYGNNIWVGVTDTTTGVNPQVMFSTNNGVTWSLNATYTLAIWSSVIFADGKFVAVGGEGGSGQAQVMYSTDGINWTMGVVPEATAWSSVTYGAGKFVAVAREGTNRVMYSTDGITWTGASAAAASPWDAVTYGDGKFVAVARTGDNQVMYSTNGINWTASSAPDAFGTWKSVTYANGTFIALSDNGVNPVMYSSDGINWARGTAPTGAWLGVVYGSDRFVAVGNVTSLPYTMWSYTGGVNESKLTLSDSTNLDKFTIGGSTLDGIVLDVELAAPSITIGGGNWEVGDVVSTTKEYTTELHDLNQQTWAKTNIDKSDWGVDTPNNYGDDSGLGKEMRGNYCTLGGETKLVFTTSTATVTNGNLSVDFFSDAYTYGTIGIPGSDSNKWYFESTIDSSDVSPGPQVGWGNIENGMVAYYRRDSETSATIGNFKGSSLTVASFDDGDILGVAVDQTTDTASFYKNGVFVGEIGMQNYEAVTLYPAVGTASTNTNTSASANFGSTAFKYPAPSGFKTLNTTNIEDGVVTPGKKAMDVITYTGTGTSRTFSGLSFSPDLVWIKGLDVMIPHVLYDTVRGPGNRLSSNATNTEFYDANSLTAFTSDGFTLGTETLYGYTNSGGYGEYVAWCWDAGDTTVLNTSGSVASQVRSNPLAGFSIVTATLSAGEDVGHGLGVTPSMILAKPRDQAANWYVQFPEVMNGGTTLYLNGVDGVTPDATWATPAATSTVLKVNSQNVSNLSAPSDWVFYCWSEVPGFSKFGKVGSSLDERYVNTGFKPRWLMYKHANSGGWVIVDSERTPDDPRNLVLLANTTDKQSNSGPDSGIYRSVRFHANGFEIGNGGAYNSDYYYAAFADMPLQYLPQ